MVCKMAKRSHLIKSDLQVVSSAFVAAVARMEKLLLADMWILVLTWG
jgi:hypothetical protein